MGGHSDFREKLCDLINNCSRENGSDTPDFILAEYLADCLLAFDSAVARRTKWYNAAKKSIAATAPAGVRDDE